MSDQEEPKAETTTPPIRIVDARTGSRLPGVVARFEPDVEAAAVAAAEAASEAKTAAETAAKKAEKATDDEALAGVAKQAKAAAERAAEQSAKTDAARKATAERKSVLAKTDEDGDLSDCALEHGHWKVSLLGPQQRPETHQLIVPIDPAELEAGKKVYRLIHLTEDIDQALGWRVLTGLCLFLVALIAVYVMAHRWYPQGSPLGTTLFEQSAAAKVAMDTTDDANEETFTRTLASMKQSIEGTEAKEDLADKLVAAGERIAELEKAKAKADKAKAEAEKAAAKAKEAAAGTETSKATAEKTKAEAGLGAEAAEEAEASKAEEANVGKAEQALAKAVESSQNAEEAEGAVAETEAVARSKEAVLDKLVEIDRLAADIREVEQRSGVAAGEPLLWRSGPKWFLEILFWALGGILVRLIYNVGEYLRWNRFYRNGLATHVKLLFISPILTLVYVLLISLIKIKADVVSVDLSDPRILAGISFLLAATPWKTWDRLMGVADQVRGSQDKGKGNGGG